jgi:hypothetical protein
MFTIAKPDGSLQSLADLREVNKVIKRDLKDLCMQLHLT